MFFYTTGKFLTSPCAGRKDDSGSALNTPFLSLRGMRGWWSAFGCCFVPVGFEIFSFVITVLGGNYYALLRTVSPQPPRGFLLSMVRCCEKCRCFGDGYGGCGEVAQRVVLLYFR